MKKITLLLVGLFFFSVGMNAQTETLDELKSMKADKEATLKTIDQDILDLDKRIKEFPGWSKGAGATLGLNFGGFSDWFANDNDLINSGTSGFSLAGNAFANNNADGYFWHNGLNIGLTRSKSKIKVGSADEQELSADGSLFTLNSLYGKQIFSQIFLSAEARYETTLISFNDPGKLTASAGLTWKPMNNLTVNIHPLGYQWNFPGGKYSSAAGCKIGANYTGEIYPGIKWTSELGAFLAYGGSDLPADAAGIFPAEVTELSTGDLSNWTWLNSFAVADIFKGIGLGATIGLRNDKTLGFARGVGDPGLQTFYTLGLSYAISQ